jgi:hypothetical protein
MVTPLSHRVPSVLVLVDLEDLDEFERSVLDAIKGSEALVETDRPLTLSPPTQRLIVKPGNLADRFDSVLPNEVDPQVKLHQYVLGKPGKSLLRNIEANIPNHGLYYP